jgi:hypothetical protein
MSDDRSESSSVSHRVFCLQCAINTATERESPQDIIATAEMFLGFIQGRNPPTLTSH